MSLAGASYGLDATFTYGGWALVLVAVAIWLWFARQAFPSFTTFVKNFDDELHFGDGPEEQARTTRLNRIRQIAVVLTVAAAVSLAIGFAIPD